MNGWIEQVQRAREALQQAQALKQAQRARETLEAEAPDLSLLPSYPFPEDPTMAALVWDLCRTGDAIVVMAKDGSRSIVVL